MGKSIVVKGVSSRLTLDRLMAYYDKSMPEHYAQALIASTERMIQRKRTTHKARIASAKRKSREYKPSIGLTTHRACEFARVNGTAGLPHYNSLRAFEKCYPK